VWVAAVVPDLLFGSKVKAALEQAGHEVVLAPAPPSGCDALVADLTAADVDVEALGATDAPTLGLYAHVDPAQRERALAAGFDLVVPRSRFVREGAALLERLVASGPSAGDPA
jgi:hypothetical protein